MTQHCFPYKVVSQYTYKSEFPCDLSFGVGEVITVISEKTPGWFYGKCQRNGSGDWEEGSFPQTYVKPLEEEDQVLLKTSTLQGGPLKSFGINVRKDGYINENYDYTASEENRHIITVYSVSETPDIINAANEESDTNDKPLQGSLLERIICIQKQQQNVIYRDDSDDGEETILNPKEFYGNDTHEKLPKNKEEQRRILLRDRMARLSNSRPFGGSQGFNPFGSPIMSANETDDIAKKISELSLDDDDPSNIIYNHQRELNKLDISSPFISSKPATIETPGNEADIEDVVDDDIGFESIDENRIIIIPNMESTNSYWGDDIQNVKCQSVSTVQIDKTESSLIEKLNKRPRESVIEIISNKEQPSPRPPNLGVTSSVIEPLKTTINNRQESNFDAFREANSIYELIFQFDPNDLWWLEKTIPTFVNQTSLNFIMEIDKKIIEKRLHLKYIVTDFYLLFEDYSQLQLSLCFDELNPLETVQFTHEIIPVVENTELLESSSTDIGCLIYSKALSIVGTHSRQFIETILSDFYGEIILPIANRTYGICIFEHERGADLDFSGLMNIRSGDILVFNQAVFENHKLLGIKDSLRLGMDDSNPHVCVVTNYGFSKSKSRVIEEHAGKIVHTSYKLKHMKSDKLKVFRVIKR